MRKAKVGISASKNSIASTNHQCGMIEPTTDGSFTLLIELGTDRFNLGHVRIE